MEYTSGMYFSFYLAQQSPQWAMASSFTRPLDHIQRRTTVRRTPLYEWSAHCKKTLPANTQHSQQTDIYAPGGIRTHDLSRRAAEYPHEKCVIVSCYSKRQSHTATCSSRSTVLQYNPILEEKITIWTHLGNGGFPLIHLRSVWRQRYSRMEISSHLSHCFIHFTWK